MMHPPPSAPATWPTYGLRTGPHWRDMTEQGGPTWAEDDAIRRWRAAAFKKANRYQEFIDDERALFGEVLG